MFKSISITVPAGTTVDDPVVTFLKLCKGTISSITIRPASGPQWELFCKIEYRETALFPFDESEWIPLEREVVRIEPNWSRWDGTYNIEILSCSPDARFTHTYMVDVEVEEGMSAVEAILYLISKGL